jgi:Flp pilus assembly protein TadG
MDSLRSEHGASLVEVALVLPVLILILLGVVDFGRAYYLSNEVAGAAHAGAVYGSQYPTDTTGMQTAAAANAPDVSGLTTTASYGCECSDGSDASTSCATVPSCSTNIVYYAKVKASVAYSPWFPWPGIPSSIAIADTVEMRSGSTSTPY